MKEKNHVPWRDTADKIFRRWITTGRICEAIIWMSNSSKTQEKQRVVKYIRITRWFQRYKADTVKLDKSLTEEEKFNYILTVIDHFS